VDQTDDPLHAIDLCLKRIVRRDQWRLDSRSGTLFPVAYHSYWIVLLFFLPHMTSTAACPVFLDFFLNLSAVVAN
jgi:hypothetical protein